MERTWLPFFARVLLVHCLNSCSATTIANISTDQSSLLSLKSHFTFDSHNHVLATNWSADTPTCDWVGVTCSSRHKRVAALNLSNMGLIGAIPPSIANLSFLVSLDMRNNTFHGNLPKELAHLHRLKYFLLSWNNFTGPIPWEIGDLRKLEWLSIRDNRLTGSVPRTLFNISSLKYVTLTSNNLSGNLPMEICSNKLERLTVALNQLDGQIPVSLYQCSNLEYLDLAYNRFTGSLASEIGNLTMLKELYIGGNSLKGEVPKEMDNLTSLEILAMEGVGVTGRIPAVFNISSLRVLYLHGNNLSGFLPVDMCLHFSVLEQLYLNKNSLSGSIEGVFDNCTSLKRLNLYDNELTGRIPNGIGNLLQLEFLSLDSNSLRGTIPPILFNITSLQTLSLVNNSFSGKLPSHLGYMLPNLELFFLDYNELIGPIPDSISNASKLLELDLSSNEFTGAVPNSLGNLALLEFLNLGTNNLSTELSSQKSSFLTSLVKCRHLIELWLHHNPLNDIIPVAFGNLSTSLESLDLSECGMKGNIPDGIGNLSSLTFLYLFSNELTGFIPRTMEGLQILALYDNDILGSIPNELCLLPNLGYLHLSMNRITGSIPSCLGNISSLRKLYLSSNKLSSIIPVELWSLKDLLKLDISSNSLSGHLPTEIGDFKAAIHIDLSFNQFSGDIPISIGDLQNLVNLSVAHNALQGHIPETFHSLISLENLDLSHNNLTGVIPKSLEALLHLRLLNVSFNSLSGEIPGGGPFRNFTNRSFMSNEALCGAPWFEVARCPSKSSGRSRTKRILLIVGIPLVTALLVLSLTLAFVLKRCRVRNKIPTPATTVPAITQGRISYYELQKATGGFDESNLLGIGNFGSVYKGVLTNGMVLAVKVFNLNQEGAFKSFDTECEVLRNLRHRNLTKVISACSNVDFKALVLEYMPNGSLEKWLYSPHFSLSILQRLDIMIDVACALEYLHHGYATPVIHCDLKPNNVLLDEDMVAHLCDFGIGKLLGEGESIAQTATLATSGYIAPEYGSEGLVSTSSDVYSYGILLMEMFTRRKPTDEMFVGDLSLKRWINDHLHPNAILNVIDSDLIKEREYITSKEECVLSVMQLASSCSAESPEERINMNNVGAKLQKIKISFCCKSWKSLSMKSF